MLRKVTSRALLAPIGMLLGMGQWVSADVSGYGIPNVINSGTAAWVKSAQSGRADLAVLGDSTVIVNGEGWDAGFIQAANNTYGLAGSGLQVVSSYGQGDGFSAYQSVGDWNTATANVPPERAGFVWLGQAMTPITDNVGTYTWGVGGPLPLGAAYDMHVYTASPAGMTGSMAASRRQYNNGYFSAGELPAVQTQTPAVGLQATTFQFPAAPLPATGQLDELSVKNVSNTSIFYSKLVRPGSMGVAVTSWPYGGRGTLPFITDQLHALSPAGRQAWLSAVVDGDSGKLNIVVAEGLNDRNDYSPSFHNIATSNTPAGFADNMGSLIGILKGDWAAAGHNPSDLSFTLMGEYQDYFASQDGATDPMRAFAQVEQQIAANDPQVSFVDLSNIAPSYSQAMADGYLLDGVHETRLGAITYAQGVVNALSVPEPASLGAVSLFASFALLRRRK